MDTVWVLNIHSKRFFNLILVTLIIRIKDTSATIVVLTSDSLHEVIDQVTELLR